jgi:hypothetical protein
VVSILDLTTCSARKISSKMTPEEEEEEDEDSPARGKRRQFFSLSAGK